MVKYIGRPCIFALFSIWLKLTLADVSQEYGILTGSSQKIYYYNLSDVDLDGRPKSYKQLLNTNEWIWTVDYHWDKKLVFGRSDHGTIYRTSFDARPVQAMLQTQGYDWEDLAVDWVHDRLIFPTRNGNLWQGQGLAIVSTDLHGGDLTVLLTRPMELGHVRRLVIDPYAGKIFWIHVHEPNIESCNLDGTEFKSIKNNLEPIELALDLPTRKVFLLNKGISLYSMDYTGENLQKHWTMAQTSIGFDMLDGTVYWFNYINGQFIFYKSHTDQPFLPEKLFFTDDENLHYMRIVHPSMQEKPCSSGRWTYYNCGTTTEQFDTSTTKSVQPSVTVTDSEEPPTTLMPLNTRQLTPSPNDSQRGQENAEYHPTHSSITDHIVVFNALVSVVLLGLVVFVIRKYYKQRHNELSIANVAYNPSGVNNLYEPCAMPQ